MRKRRVLQAAAAVVALAFTLVAPAANGNAASAATTARNAPAGAITPDDLAGVRVCSLGGNDLCMNGFDGIGGDGIHGIVKGFADNGTSPDPTQDTNVDQVSNCGGVVTTTPTPCPFTNPVLDGTGPNGYGGDKIVSIFNSANGMAYHWDGHVGVIEQPTGDGQVWVQDGTLTGNNAGAVLVNVADTNAQGGIPTVVCTNNPGKPLVLDTLMSNGAPPAKCDWVAKNG
jgi:hypothetical protein